MPPMPSPAPTPAPSIYDQYQAALARMQSASPYAMATPTATPVASAGAPNVGQQAAQTALQVLAKREIGKALLDKGASAAAPEILSATRLGSSTASSAAPEILSATRIPGTTPPGSFWTTAPETGGFNQIASGAAALHGGYAAINDWQKGGSGRSGLTQAGAGVGNIIGGPLGGAIGAGFGNIMGYGLQGTGIKNHLALLATAPPLAVARLLGFNPIHKTTKQFQQEHNQELSKMGDSDSVWQNYLKGARQGHGTTGPADPSKPFFGKYATFDEYKKAGLDAGNLTHVYGNLKTFGPDWAKINEDQRKAVTQGLIDAGLYNSKKGEVEITNAEKAKQIYKEKIDAFMKGAKK